MAVRLFLSMCLVVLFPALAFGAEVSQPDPRRVVGGEITSNTEHPFVVYVVTPSGSCTGLYHLSGLDSNRRALRSQRIRGR